MLSTMLKGTPSQSGSFLEITVFASSPRGNPCLVRFHALGENST